MMETKDFIDDKEKMKDFNRLSKEEFLNSYSYLTEKEYKLTKEVLRMELKNKLVTKVLGYLKSKGILDEQEKNLRDLCWKIQTKKTKGGVE